MAGKGRWTFQESGPITIANIDVTPTYVSSDSMASKGGLYLHSLLVTSISVGSGSNSIDMHLDFDIDGAGDWQQAAVIGGGSANFLSADSSFSGTGLFVSQIVVGGNDTHFLMPPLNWRLTATRDAGTVTDGSITVNAYFLRDL